MSIHHDRAAFPVYSQQEWWSDSWDPKAYGRDFDFNRPFFEQFLELRYCVPRLPLLVKESINSEYTNHAANNKNCFLSFIVFDCEDVLYSRKIVSSRSVIDCAHILSNGELLYQCALGENLYQCCYSQFCFSSSDLMFCYDCRNCHHCFMSSNLRNSEYVFRNEKLSKKEYFKAIKDVYLGSQGILQAYLTEYQTMVLNTPKPALRLEECENVSGDHLISCRNCHDCYYSSHGEDCRYSVEFDGLRGQISKDCVDCFGFGGAELLYEVHAQANGYHNLFCSWSYDVAESLYCDMCFNIRNCFGSVGLHAHEQFCVLNKQYRQEEYQELVPKIVDHMKTTGEWGEFFPVSTSLFGYNETLAAEHFPLSREEALAQGFCWSDYQPEMPSSERIVQAHELPDDIREVDDEILRFAIECSNSKRLFRIQPFELEFYRKQGLALPRKHYDLRHAERMQFRNPMQSWVRNCAKSGEKIVTSFPPDYPDIVVSKEVYLKTIY